MKTSVGRSVPTRLAALAAVGLMAAAAPVDRGEPLSGVRVGLETWPDNAVTTMTTDRRGRAEFEVEAARARIVLPPAEANTDRLDDPRDDPRDDPWPGDWIVARVQAGRTVHVSAPMPAGNPRNAYFRDRDGWPLVIFLPPDGGRVRVTLTEAGDGPRRRHRDYGGRVGLDHHPEGPSARARNFTPDGDDR